MKKISFFNNNIVINFDYDSEIVACVKSIYPKGRYNPSDKSWNFSIEALESVINKLEKYDFVLEDSLINYLKESKEKEKSIQLEIEERLEYCINYLEKYIKDKTIKPFKHQWEAVRFFLNQSNLRCLISDDMGLGKSISSLLCAKALQGWYQFKYKDNLVILVLAPVSLKQNWLKEAQMLNMEIEIFSISKMPKPLENRRYIVISDEAHYFQNWKSKRTQNFIELVESNNCKGLIELTGTPMKNGRPSNLYPLLYALQHPIAKNKTAYERRYCDAHPTIFTQWDITGSSNLEELNEKISDKVIRRLKEECLDLPPKLFSDIECEYNKEAEEEYNKFLKHLFEEYISKIERGEISGQGSAIVKIGFYRHASSIYKSYESIRLTEELLEQGKQVVVFTDFIESAERISKYFGVLPLTGATPQKAKDENGNDIYPRQKLVDDFQSGKTRVFVGTIKAGGVGITLTASSYLIINDFPWTPGDLQQAHDRIYRIGQTKTCNIYHIYGKQIDYVIADLIGQKSANINKVLKKLKITEKIKRNPSEFYEHLLLQLEKA